ncbi:hypothetical protein CERZMDRAFT_97622 [Cercospora zeae-maydis SCOH1-5]|uniref:Uncharacterized protein n=1 Tax=Cercospora zeae-maydis SCOH1-5 TaxID=717836 RepID=A0A6A6FG01_9PEZI|nr:hypothetical protein CERZMDRAFT_97622 [Cercospora zeae-maydis SCOH1-5]
MPTNVRILLRLSPAIQQQLLCTPLPSGTCSNLYHGSNKAISFRYFSIGGRFSKQGGNNNAKYKNALPRTPTPQARNLPKPQQAPPSLKNAPPAKPPVRGTAPAPRTSTLPPAAMDWMSTRFPKQDHVLLYVAPDHKAFFISSIVIGTFLIMGCWSYAGLFLKEPSEDSQLPKLPFSIRAIGAVSVIAGAAFGTTFLLAPMKMIKSITAIRQQTSNRGFRAEVPWNLQVEVKMPFPFVKPKSRDVYPKDVALDRNLPAASENVGFTSHDIKNSEWFTALYYSGKLEEKRGSALSRFNSGLINLWPGIKRDVRRMFLRDHMAYLRIKGAGNYKLDVQNCHMLDDGRVLHRLVSVDADAKAGSAWRKFLVRLLGDRNDR